jgi:imidazolonepropionase-like amidohydrolase
MRQAVTAIVLAGLACPAVLRADEAPAPPAPEAHLLITAGAVHVGDGTVLTPGQVLVTDGVIKEVGTDLKAPEGARRWDLPDAVVTPGLVDPAARVPAAPGEARGGLEAAVRSTADFRSPFDPWLEVVRAGGVVASCLLPGARGGILGRAATMGTEGPRAGGAPLLAEEVALVVDLAATGGSTARAQAREALGRALEQAAEHQKAWKEWTDQEEKKPRSGGATKSGARHPDDRGRTAAARPAAKKEVPKPEHSAPKEVLARVNDRKLPLRLVAHRREDVEHALRTARQRDLRVTLQGCAECADLAARLAESRAIVVLEPLAWSPGEDELRGRPDADVVRALAAADVRLAVGGGPWPHGACWLRTAAGALVAAGLAPERAVAAMTGLAAEAAGIGSTHGRIASGRRAQLALWTGDPLDPRTRLQRLIEPDDTRPGPAPEPTP